MKRTFLAACLGLVIASRCLAGGAGKVFLSGPDPRKAYGRFHVGVTGIYATIEKGLVTTVQGTERGTPADGKFNKGKPKEFKLLGDIYEMSTGVKERGAYTTGFKDLFKVDKVSMDPEAIKYVARIIGKSMCKARLPHGTATPAQHEAAHRAMMTFRGWDPKVYKIVEDDLYRYLTIWTPYHQHSVWLITGNRWQVGYLKVLALMGKNGKRICAALKGLLGKLDTFDTKRRWAPGTGMKGRATEIRKIIEDKIRKAVEDWEAKYGRVKAATDI